ncbi:MAG: hypothetical protein Q9169_008438 [Polycauliona sp. 2 TL-2023]
MSHHTTSSSGAESAMDVANRHTEAVHDTLRANCTFPDVASLDDKSCAICFDNFAATNSDEGLTPVKLRCGHVFCKSCVTTWTKDAIYPRLPECPMCRRPYVSKIQHYVFTLLGLPISRIMEVSKGWTKQGLKEEFGEDYGLEFPGGQAWWSLLGDPRHPHSTASTLPPSFLITLGILHYHFPTSSPSSATDVNDLATTRAYSIRDVITISPLAMGSTYEDNIQMFYREHLHEDEEIRYILEGGGYFDVRDKEDRWVRIEVESGDLLVLPAGIYHRFTVDGNDFIKAMRLFKDLPKWTALYRGEETEKSDVRKAYLAARQVGFAI